MATPTSPPDGYDHDEQATVDEMLISQGEREIECHAFEDLLEGEGKQNSQGHYLKLLHGFAAFAFWIIVTQLFSPLTRIPALSACVSV